MGLLDNIPLPPSYTRKEKKTPALGGSATSSPLLRNVPMPGQAPAAPAPRPYFAAVDPKGNSFGFSDTEKDTSGRPLFAFRKPGDEATTTDYTRVATKIDPRVAQPLTRDDYYNPRAVENRLQLKQALGANYSDELDHAIALTLSGSNDPKNLRVISGDKNAKFGVLEAKLGREVASGKKSLFDAQIEAAKAKGIDIPFTGEEQKDTWDKVLEKIKGFFGANTAEAQTVPTILTKDVPLPTDPEKFPGLSSYLPSKLVSNLGTATAETTPQTTERGTVDDLASAGKYLFDPRAEIAAPRVPFFSAREQANIPKFVGPRAITGTTAIASNILSAFIESPVRLAATIAGETAATKGGELRLPFDPTRIGLPEAEANKYTPIFTENLNRLNQLDEERPGTPNLNLAQSFFETTFNRAILDPIVTGDVVKALSRAILSASKSSPQLGLSASSIKDLSPQEAFKEFGTRLFDRADQILRANTNSAGVLSTSGRRQMTQLLVEAKRLSKAFAQEKIPELNAIEKFFDNVAIRLNQDVVNLGKSTGLTAGGTAKAAEETLPGYKARYAGSPAGLSTQPVEPVGFGPKKTTGGVTVNADNNLKMYEKLIESKEITPEKVYSNVSTKTYQPDIAKHIVEDSTDALNKFSAGYGDKFAKLVDINNTSPTQIRQAIDTVLKQQADDTFKGFTDVSTNILNKLEGRSSVSHQFISDLTNSPNIKQAERDLIRNILADYPATAAIPVKEFAKAVRSELLPLSQYETGNVTARGTNVDARYEQVVLPDDLRGPIENYSEKVYESPIKTSAGQAHFNQKEVPKYFAHTRIEDLPPDSYIPGEFSPAPDTKGTTRRIIEIQSDLFQKGRLEGEAFNDSAASLLPPAERKRLSYAEKKILDIEDPNNIRGVEPYKTELAELKSERDSLMKKAVALREKAITARASETSKLEPYRNIWHERIIREEIKQAAADAKKTVLFPTGETALKIEGLGDNTFFDNVSTELALTPEELKQGLEITYRDQYDDPSSRFIITDVLGDGKFKAVPKNSYDEYQKLTQPGAIDRLNETARKLGQTQNFYDQARMEREYLGRAESFDISGKIDTNNPIYKFYEKEVGRYLKNKYNATPFTDKQGVTWWKVDVSPTEATKPVSAYSVHPRLFGGPKDSIENIKKLIFKEIPEKDVRLVFSDELIDGIANGQYREAAEKGVRKIIKPVIDLYQEGGKVRVRAAFHESFHYIFNNFLTPTQRAEALATARKEIGIINTAVYRTIGYKGREKILEEYLADEWAKTKTSEAGYSGPLENFFKNFNAAVKRIIETIKTVGKRIAEYIPKNRQAGHINFFDDLKPKKKLTDDETGLIEEAKKYKSAEEFYKSQTDPLLELKKLGNVKDGIGAGTVRSAIDDIGGIDNVRRGTMNIDKFEITEKINTNSTRYKAVEAEVKKGNITPIITDEYGRIMDGHHRLEVYKTMGMKDIPVIVPKETAGVKFQTKSQLTDIYNKATESQSGTRSGKLSDEEIEQANKELTKQIDEVAKKKKADVEDVIKTKEETPEIKEALGNMQIEQAITEEALLANPARQLSKYANKKTGELPETVMTGVGEKAKGIFAQKGDDIASQLGYETSEDAREAYQKYLKSKERYLAARQNIQDLKKDFRDKKEIIEAVTQELRREGRNRKQRIDAIQDFFKLTDEEMREVVRKNSDYRLISEKEFENILTATEGKAYDAFLKSNARTQLEYTIFEKELVKVDNLRKAMKLPEIQNMTRAQLEKFDELLQPFKTGDEFLGMRQIQTIKNTDLENIKTKREALEDLAKRTNTPIEEMQKIRATELDRYLYDVALARRNPFFKVMVEDASKALTNANVRLYEMKTALNNLIAKARRSRKQGILNKFIPTDKAIFDYLEADAFTKSKLAQGMTPEELNAAQYIFNKYAEARDYLVARGQLDRYRRNYITHVQRSFLEALKDSMFPRTFGRPALTAAEAAEQTLVRRIIKPFKELLEKFKQEEANFTIMNQKTGDVLPLEKFFKFSMTRTGELVPTRNVARAVTAYFSAFEKKAALDTIVPKIDVYAHSLTPRGMTKRGLELDDSLKRFVREWLNTKRGRVFEGHVKPGGKVDWALRTGVAITRLLDLGLNIPIGLASNLGEQVATVINIGAKKTALGAARALTPQGKKIAEKYTGLVGETFMERMQDGAKDLSDKFLSSVLGLFAAAARRANIEHLLGSMTKEEFAKGAISAERLGEIRLEIGKYRVINDASSVVGASAPGKVFTQYKTWAVPILHTTISNLKTLAKTAAKGEKFTNTKEFQETLRASIFTTLLLVASFGLYTHYRDKKDRNFVEQIAFKSINDALSMLGALDVSLWTSPTRLQSFIADLGESVSNIVASLSTGERTLEKDEIKGLEKLTSTITPAFLRPFFRDQTAAQKFMPKFQEIKDLVDDGKIEEAQAAIEALTDDEYEAYKNIKASLKRKETLELSREMDDTVYKVRELVKQGKNSEAQSIVDDLTDAEYRAYQSAKKRIEKNEE